MARGAMPIARRNEVSFISAGYGMDWWIVFAVSQGRSKECEKEGNCCGGLIAGLFNGMETED